jgi:hypothetical protein
MLRQQVRDVRLGLLDEMPGLGVEQAESVSARVAERAACSVPVAGPLDG